MPAGVSLSKYLRFSAAALLTMMAGSQCVHYYYKPLEGLEKLAREEAERRSQQIMNSKSLQ